MHIGDFVAMLQQCHFSFAHSILSLSAVTHFVHMNCSVKLYCNIKYGCDWLWTRIHVAIFYQLNGWNGMFFAHSRSSTNIFSLTMLYVLIHEHIISPTLSLLYNLGSGLSHFALLISVIFFSCPNMYVTHLFLFFDCFIM